MTELNKTFWVPLVRFYTNLSAGQRTALIVLTLAVSTVAVGSFYWTSDSSYQVLGTNFNPEDASTVIRLLREKKIPFRMENDGKTIKIPPEVINDFRIALATSGLPQAGIVGYEVFDKQSFGTTSLVQRINQKRALEGELMRTINNLKGIKRSRIHLAIPPQSTFSEDQKRPTASVVLEVEPGVRMTSQQISGIAHMIASAVEGMKTDDVTIVDAHGSEFSSAIAPSPATVILADISEPQKVDVPRNKTLNRIRYRFAPIAAAAGLIFLFFASLLFRKKTEVFEPKTIAELEGLDTEQEQSKPFDQLELYQPPETPSEPIVVRQTTPAFEALEWVDAETIAAFLVDEHPQTIALIVESLDSTKKTEVLMRLPKTIQTEVANRIEDLDFISPTLIAQIDEVLKQELTSFRFKGSSQSIADFEDMVQLNDQDIQKILKEIPIERLRLSLKTASDDIKDKFYRNMPENDAQYLRNQIESLGAVRLADVETAQQEIIREAGLYV